MINVVTAPEPKVAGPETIEAKPAERSGMWLEDTVIWRIKLRLQFSGWLQYSLNAVLVLLFLALAGIGRLVSVWQPLLLWTPLVIGLLLFVNLVVDVFTLKYGIRPAEALPAPRENLDPFELMRARRACRSFQARELTPENHAALLASVRENSLPERQIGKCPIRFEYVAAPLTVWPVVGARDFLVAIAPAHYDRLAIIDIGRGLQKVVLDATRMGLSTCWIGPGADQKSVIHELGERFDPARDHVVCVCAVGYKSVFVPFTVRLMNFKMHQRLPLTKLFFADPHFEQPLDTSQPPFSSYGRCYEVCQWSPSSYNSQTTRCAAATERRSDAATRLKRFDFAASTYSRFYAAVALGIWLANWETGCAALGKHGHFTVLSPAERGVADAPDLPHYDVSWMVELPESV